MTQEPAIPRAIPAHSSVFKPLSRDLRSETNIYIRGLLPKTTGEDLKASGSHFGDIEESRSIVDPETGLCKGYVAHIDLLSSW